MLNIPRCPGHLSPLTLKAHSVEVKKPFSKHWPQCCHCLMTINNEMSEAQSGFKKIVGVSIELVRL